MHRHLRAGMSVSAAVAAWWLSVVAAAGATVDFTGFTDRVESSGSYAVGDGFLSVVAMGVGNIVQEVPSRGGPAGLGVGESLQEGGPGGRAIGLGEVLQFTLPTGYQLDSFSVSTRSRNTAEQSFDLLVDGLSVGRYTTAALGGQQFSFSPGFSGSVFSIVPTTMVSGNPDGVFLGSVTIAPVPLPATAPVLAGALVLGAFAVRRRRKAVEPEKLAA